MIRGSLACRADFLRINTYVLSRLTFKINTVLTLSCIALIVHCTPQFRRPVLHGTKMAHNCTAVAVLWIISTADLAHWHQPT